MKPQWEKCIYSVLIVLKDAMDHDDLHVPVKVVNHRVSTTPRKMVDNGQVSVTKDQHVRAQTI